MTATLRDSSGGDIHQQEVDGQPNIILLRGAYYQRTGLVEKRALFCEGVLLELAESTVLTPPAPGGSKLSTVAETGSQKKEGEPTCA